MKTKSISKLGARDKKIQTVVHGCWFSADVTAACIEKEILKNIKILKNPHHTLTLVKKYKNVIILKNGHRLLDTRRPFEKLLRFNGSHFPAVVVGLFFYGAPDLWMSGNDRRGGHVVDKRSAGHLLVFFHGL